MNNLIIKDLYRASLFCKMSYYTPSEMENTSNHLFADIKKIVNYDRYFEDINLRCYVFNYHNTIFISFNSLLLYKSNKQLDKLKDSIYIHGALLQQYKAIESMLNSHISALGNAITKKIYITGYYMGGGLATIAAAILGEKYKNMYLVSCFTFAAPKVGNKHFREYFRDNVTCNYRVIVNDKIDLITNLNNYNSYNYYKHHCSLYAHFVTKDYYHVSNAFLLENNNILEFSKPKLTKSEKVLMKCHSCNPCCNNYMDELVDIEIYIDRFSSIIAKYKTNIMQKQKSLMNATIAIPSAPTTATKYFETFAISSSSEASSEVSDRSSNKKSPTAAENVKPEDLKQLQDRFDKLLALVNSKFCT